MIHTAATLKSVLDIEVAEAGPAIAKNPGSAGRIANGLARSLGAYEAVQEWEMDMADMATFVEKDNWSDLRVIATQHRILAQMALRPVGDEWSGRSNDERRSYHDGRRGALNDLFQSMSHAYGQAVQADGGLVIS